MARLRVTPDADGLVVRRQAPKFKAERCVVDGARIAKGQDAWYFQRDGAPARFCCLHHDVLAVRQSGLV